MTDQCTYRYVNLLYYEQCILLHVSATIVAIFREVFCEGQNIKIIYFTDIKSKV